MKTTITIKNIEEKESQTGKQYWSVETDQGKMSVFDAKIVEKLRESMRGGKFAEIELVENDRGFKNIRRVYNGDVKEEKFDKARELKDQSIYTSYAKDIFVAIYKEGSEQEFTRTEIMNEAIKLVKQAKEAFK